MPNENGVNEFDLSSIDLDALFADETTQETPPAEEGTATNEPESTDDVQQSEPDTTKAFARRLRESTDKARTEEREAIAKSLGYASYDDLTKSREKKLIEEKGFDAADVTPLVDQLVKERIDNDPRMQELNELRQMKVQEFARKELAEITRLSGGEITSINQLKPEVIEAWKKKGSLKSAYLEVEGENRIMKIMSDQSKGTTSHLANASGTAPMPTGMRTLTAAEKQMYKFFNPSMTDEDLNKLTVKE